VGLIHRCRLVQFLSMVMDAGLGVRWTTVGLHSPCIWLVKLVVGSCLEACPRWYSDKLNGYLSLQGMLP
jgi:hypothetical protein